MLDQTYAENMAGQYDFFTGNGQEWRIWMDEIFCLLLRLLCAYFISISAMKALQYNVYETEIMLPIDPLIRDGIPYVFAT